MDKVICVGKNYLKHAQELGDAIPTEPLYFFKPESAIFHVKGSESTVILPPEGEIHHELELVLEVHDHKFTRYTLGLDLTLRDLQNRLKKAGQPWEKAKVFKNSCILGPWQAVTSLEELMAAEFSLTVNGKLRQKGRGSDMRWGPSELLADLQHYFPVCDGDIIFTGTPEGVGPLVHGDQLLVRGPRIEYRLLIDRAV